MDIEAVTGMIARGFLRLQLNAPILKNFVKEPRIKGRLNISYLAEASEKLYLKSIPVLWGEYGGQASEDNIDTIKKKVREWIICKIDYIFEKTQQIPGKRL
jgi:hypothetical protein